MKIIAQTRTGSYPRFLVEIEESELRQVAQTQAGERLEIGQTVEVNAAWKDLRDFRSAKERILAAAETLKACAQLSITASAVYVIPQPPES